MKRTVFVQNVPHWPTVWGDCLADINLTYLQTGLGLWSIREYYQTLHYWSKNNFNLCLDVVKNDPKFLSLDHFYKKNTGDDNAFNSAKIDMQMAFDYLDQDPMQRYCIFGLPFEPDNFNVGPDTITDRSNWISRIHKHGSVGSEDEANEVLDSKFFLLADPSNLHTVSNVLHVVAWFFLWRATDLPIYYLIPNPDLIGVSPTIDATDSDEIRYHVINPHFGPIGDTVFRPSFSSNVKKLTPQKIVAGDKFHVVPFEDGVFHWHYKEQFPKVPLKISSNLKYERDPETNKITFEFNPGQESGYFQIRWGSGSAWDVVNASPSLDFIENKCKITIDVHKDSRYKYKE